MVESKSDNSTWKNNFIDTESLLEMFCATDVVFCCLFPSVLAYYQWLALHFLCDRLFIAKTKLLSSQIRKYLKADNKEVTLKYTRRGLDFLNPTHSAGSTGPL